LRGRELPSGRWRPNGGIVGTAGLRHPALGPRFDRDVPAGGYSWWYVDAISQDGRYGLTIIGFIGSVFSPYYKASGRGDPLDHCSLNVALYGPLGAKRWAMTERGNTQVSRDATTLQIDRSALHWDGTRLTIDIDERACPFPLPVRGRITLTPEIIGGTAFALDPAQRHMWHPLAPRAHCDVQLSAPDLSWQGAGYFDSNTGSEALEDGFKTWEWSRAHLGPDVGVIYEGVRRDGGDFALALRCKPDGHWEDAPLPPRRRLMPTLFAMPRSTRADRARVLKTWEDAPFYSRSKLRTKMWGVEGEGVHESLSMDRFVSPVTQWMLPYRMPRRA